MLLNTSSSHFQQLWGKPPSFAHGAIKVSPVNKAKNSSARALG